MAIRSGSMGMVVGVGLALLCVAYNLVSYASAGSAFVHGPSQPRLRLQTPKVARAAELTEAQRKALRLDSAEDQAAYQQKMKDKQEMEEMLKQNGSIEHMDPISQGVYKVAAAGVLWTWINNFYKMWTLGHPEAIVAPVVGAMVAPVV